MNDLLGLLPAAGLVLIALVASFIVWRQEHPKPKRP